MACTWIDKICYISPRVSLTVCKPVLTGLHKCLTPNIAQQQYIRWMSFAWLQSVSSLCKSCRQFSPAISADMRDVSVCTALWPRFMSVPNELWCTCCRRVFWREANEPTDHEPQPLCWLATSCDGKIEDTVMMNVHTLRMIWKRKEVRWTAAVKYQVTRLIPCRNQASNHRKYDTLLAKWCAPNWNSLKQMNTSFEIVYGTPSLVRLALGLLYARTLRPPVQSNEVVVLVR